MLLMIWNIQGYFKILQNQSLPQINASAFNFISTSFYYFSWNLFGVLSQVVTGRSAERTLVFALHYQ